MEFDDDINTVLTANHKQINISSVTNDFDFVEMQKRIIKLLLLIDLITLVAPGVMQIWTLEVVELKTYTSDPNVLDLDFKVVRLRRGVYGVSGFWNLKVDFYDDTLVLATAERSKNRDGPFSKIPMGVDNETLSNAMNKFYKAHLQKITQKCCENAPVMEDKFTAPLTARNIVATNCEIETDNFPNIMMEGYYRVRVSLLRPNYIGYLEGLFLIENKHL